MGDAQPTSFSFISVWREAHESVVRRISVDGLMGVGGIVGGELSAWQVENMAPFLTATPRQDGSADGEVAKRERVPRGIARARAAQEMLKREKGLGRKERKRMARKEKKNPALTVTARFKQQASRRPWELEPVPRRFKEFITQQQQEQQSTIDLELHLQRMHVGQPQAQQPPPLTEPAQVTLSKTARRRINTSVNEMSGLFASCCHLSPPQGPDTLACSSL